MNRRSFLRWIGGTAAGAAIAPTLDLERLLWVPGEKTIFLPPDRVISLTVGDVFTIGGIYAQNPVTGKYTDFLQQYIVTADTVSGSTAIEHAHPRIIVPSLLERRKLGAAIQPLSARLV